MNHYWKKAAALLVALLLVISFAGCLEKDGTDAAAPEATDGTDTAAELDYTATAIELGDVKITVQDLKDIYDEYSYYMQYYGMDVDAESAVSYAEQSALNSYLLVWQAGVQGLTLSDDELKEVDASAEDQRKQLIDYYVESLQEQGGTDVTDYETYALEQIESDVMSNYGITFDEYMDTYRTYLINSKLGEKVEAAFNDTIDITDDEVTTWYTDTSAEQATTFETTPTDYQSVVEDYESGASPVPALVVPEGYSRVRLVCITPEEELDAAYDTNKTEMTALEAEYGALVLTNTDAERQAEIKTRYAELQTENDALYEAYVSVARENAAKAKEALDGGTAFADVMKTFNSVEPTDAALEKGELLYTAEAQDDLGTALIEAIAALTDGAYSDVILVGDSYYIVQLVGAEPAGTVAFADAKDAIRAAALDEKRSTAWTEIQDEWYTEASGIAVYYRDAYATLGQ